MAETVGVHERAPSPPAAEPARRRRPIPSSLAALLAVTAIMGVAWALVLPAWQAPDEAWHFAYVQSLVDGPGLPGDPARPGFSTRQLAADDAVNASQLAASPATRPEWDPGAWQRFRAISGTLPRDNGGGPNPAAPNPPLAYLAYAVPYLAAFGGNPFDELEAMRLASVLWLLVTVAGAWALAGEAFGRRPAVQLAASAVPALTPMTVSISASVNPDAMLIATWTLSLWLGARLLRRGLTLKRGVAFLGVVGLACLVKATSYALVPGALLAFAIAWVRAGGGVRRLLPLAALAIPVGGWIVVARALNRPASQQLTAAASASGFNIRELASYLWQFYLPRLGFMNDMAPSLPVYEVFMKGAWGRFAWLEVVFPEPVYWLLSAATAVVTVAGAVWLWHSRRRLDFGLLAFFAVTALTLLAGLHWQEYHSIVGGAGRFMQGRYLLPLIGLAGLMTASATAVLPRRLRGAGIAVVVGGLFALQVFSLGLVVERFYL